MSPFSLRLEQSKAILMDGATGTLLEERGVDSSSPIWSAIALIEVPEMVEQIHIEYLEAGAEIITTNTFRTQQRALGKVSMGNKAFALTKKAVELTRSAIQRSGKKAFIAGSMAPLEDCYSPELVPDNEDLNLEHALMAENLAVAGVDLLLIETMNTAREAAAAANAARQTGLPFGVSFVCGEDGLLLSGESLAEAVRAAEVYGPAFLGVNCIPALSLQKALKDLGHSSDLPLAAYGNIGHSDHFQVWEDTQDHDLKDYADLCAQWLSSGVRLIGGCCGSNPEHIAALAETLNKETL